MDNIITAKGIKRSFLVGNNEEFFALQGVDIDIPKGSLTILKGRSGSGKTTLLNILSTLDIPTEGSITMGDVVYSELTDAGREELRRTRVGFVFQSVALIPVMNAYENIDFALRLAGVSRSNKKAMKDTVSEKIYNSLSLVGMQDRALHMPGQMSGGEQQRIAIARAIVHKPDIVFADEPTGALDTENGIKVMNLFKKLTEQEGITIVMTTHDPNLMEMGDVVYELEDGRIVSRTDN